jgi:hypothetical protein
MSNIISNILKRHQLFGRRTLLAIPLSASLIAFACTTDRTLGNGNLSDYPGVRSAPTSGATTGSQTAPVLPPPMTSSYSRPETPEAIPRTIKKLTPDEAALIMVDHRPTVRVLGPVSPALADTNGSVSLTSNSAIGSASVSDSLSTATVTPEGTTVVPVPLVARSITPTSTAGRITPTSTARSVQPVSNAVNINPTPAGAVRIVNDDRGVTVTNQ